MKHSINLFLVSITMFLFKKIEIKEMPSIFSCPGLLSAYLPTIYLSIYPLIKYLKLTNFYLTH